MLRNLKLSFIKLALVWHKVKVWDILVRIELTSSNDPILILTITLREVFKNSTLAQDCN